MRSTGKQFKLEELASAAGVSIRTIRYYVQRGLLQAPEFRARGTAYDQGHLLRLQAIRQLQARFLPLDAIAGVLAECDEEGLARLAAGADPGPAVWAPAATEAEFVRQARTPAAPGEAPTEPRRAIVSVSGPSDLAKETRHQSHNQDQNRIQDLNQNQTPVMETPPHPLSQREAMRGTTWRRWELAPGLELQLSDTADQKVRELAERLRSLAQEGETTT